MLEKDIVNKKIIDFFGDAFVSKVTIFDSKQQAIILVETKEEYALAAISDFRHLPIGDYDVFIENKVKKSGNNLEDMAKIMKFSLLNSETNLKQLQEKVLKISRELVDIGESFSKETEHASMNN